MPQNELAEVYTELLARQRLEPASFHHKVKEMVMPGAYRRLVQRPRDLSWQYFRYTDPRVPLARTDLARLRGDPEPQGVADAVTYQKTLELIDSILDAVEARNQALLSKKNVVIV